MFAGIDTCGKIKYCIVIRNRNPPIHKHKSLENRKVLCAMQMANIAMAIIIELHSEPYMNIGLPLTHKNRNTTMYCVLVGLILF